MSAQGLPATVQPPACGARFRTHSGSASLRALAEAFCHERRVSFASLRGAARTRDVSCLRQDLMAMAYDTGRYSLAAIGEFLGRGHSTVLYGSRQSRARAESAARRNPET